MLGFTVSYLLAGFPAQRTLLALQIGLGIVYAFLSVAEFSSRLAKMSLPVDRYYYLPYSIVSGRLIKLGAFAIAAAVLYASYTSLAFLSVILCIIILSESLVFALKVRQKVFYVSLMANYILISLEQEKKIFASEVNEIEYRYDIFFLTMKDKRARSIEVVRLDKSQQQAFRDKFVQWATRNKLKFTEEAKSKLLLA